MPHSTRKNNSTPGFAPAQFVNPVLTDDEKARIKSTVWTLESAEDCLSKLCDGGYKVTIRFDIRNDCFACWLISPDKPPNKGYILAGRGSTAIKALKQAAYVHFVLYEGDWTEGGTRSTEAIDD